MGCQSISISRLQSPAIFRASHSSLVQSPDCWDLWSVRVCARLPATNPFRPLVLLQAVGYHRRLPLVSCLWSIEELGLNDWGLELNLPVVAWLSIWSFGLDSGNAQMVSPVKDNTPTTGSTRLQWPNPTGLPGWYKKKWAQLILEFGPTGVLIIRTQPNRNLKNLGLT